MRLIKVKHRKIRKILHLKKEKRKEKERKKQKRNIQSKYKVE